MDPYPESTFIPNITHNVKTSYRRTPVCKTSEESDMHHHPIDLTQIMMLTFVHNTDLITFKDESNARPDTH